jgi:hypothetical protein
MNEYSFILWQDSRSAGPLLAPFAQLICETRARTHSWPQLLQKVRVALQQRKSGGSNSLKQQ